MDPDLTARFPYVKSPEMVMTTIPSSAIVVLISTASYARIRPIILGTLYSPPACSLLALEAFYGCRGYKAPSDLRNAEKAPTSER
jgi:hypothetical protein